MRLSLTTDEALDTVVRRFLANGSADSFSVAAG
jgi:hypothetical protein